MCALVYMASRDKVDVEAFHKGIQYALERTVLLFKSKRHKGAGNEIVGYSRALCLGADENTHELDIHVFQCKLMGQCTHAHVCMYNKISFCAAIMISLKTLSFLFVRQAGQTGSEAEINHVHENPLLCF